MACSLRIRPAALRGERFFAVQELPRGLQTVPLGRKRVSSMTAEPGSKSATTYFLTHEKRARVMSPLVRKNAKGHCSEPSTRRVGQPEYPTGENSRELPQLPQWQFSTKTLRPRPRVPASISSSHREILF